MGGEQEGGDVVGGATLTKTGNDGMHGAGGRVKVGDRFGGMRQQ